ARAVRCERRRGRSPRPPLISALAALRREGGHGFGVAGAARDAGFGSRSGYGGRPRPHRGAGGRAPEGVDRAAPGRGGAPGGGPHPAMARAAASLIATLTRLARQWSRPRNIPGKQRTLLIWFG